MAIKSSLKIIFLLFLIFTVYLFSEENKQLGYSLYKKGFTAFARRDYELARYYFQLALLKGYKNPKMLFFLAYMYDKFFLYDVAYDYYKMAITENNLPKDVKKIIKEQMIKYKKNKEKYDFFLKKYYKERNKDMLIKYINMAISTSYKEAIRYSQRGIKEENVYEKARLYKLAMSEDPLFFRAYILLGDLYRKRGLKSTSTFILSLTKRHHFSFYMPLLYRIADGLLYEKKYQAAINIFDIVIKNTISKPLKYLAYMKKIIALLYKGEYKKAYNVYINIRKERPSSFLDFVFGFKNIPPKINKKDKYALFLIHICAYDKAKIIINQINDKEKRDLLTLSIYLSDCNKKELLKSIKTSRLPIISAFYKVIIEEKNDETKQELKRLLSAYKTEYPILTFIRDTVFYNEVYCNIDLKALKKEYTTFQEPKNQDTKKKDLKHIQ